MNYELCFMNHIHYKGGYKYQLSAPYLVDTPFRPDFKHSMHHLTLTVLLNLCHGQISSVHQFGQWFFKMVYGPQ